MLNEAMYHAVKSECAAAGARLIAVTKQRNLADLQRLYDLGQRDFGENRVSELQGKYEALPKDIRWHFIGHLQRNKVKVIAPFVHLIHSGDSPRLIREVNKQAQGAARTIPVLLQYHIAAEESKYGLDPNHPLAILDALADSDLSHVTLAGVMGMATYTDADEQVSEEFERLRSVFNTLNVDGRLGGSFQTISMGMSGDYPIALQHGSNMVRVGSILFR